jgi:RHS repeat-associated protein
MKKILFILITLSFTVVTNTVFSQITGGGNGAAGVSEEKAQTTGGDALSSNVNLMNGTLQTSYTLGSVSTPTGLTYTQTLSYSSTYATGDNTPFMSGIPYGEGWALDVPSITIKTATKHKYTQGNHEDYERSVVDNPIPGITFDNNEAKDEGKLEYFSPEINIPGVVSGRLIFKGFTHVKNGASAREAVYVLHNFSSTYIEVTLRDDNSWKAVLPDGSVYIFGERKRTVFNAQNQRFKDNVGADAIMETRKPKKITTTWYVTYIENPSQHHNYRIVFNYKKLGKFDFHQEQVYFYQDAGEPLHYQLQTTAIYRDIFLENISAVYNDPNTIAIEDPANPGQVNPIAIIELEKLDFIYEEDLSIRKPDGMSTLPGVLYSSNPNVETHDELYNKIVVYDAKDNVYSKFLDWKRYEHIRKDQVSTDNFASKTNPFITGTGTGIHYKRRATAGSTGTNAISLNHSFLESPRIAIQKTNDVSNMPPGDLYEVYAVIEGHNQEYCNYDINIVTGNTFNDDNPVLSTSTIDQYLESDFKDARHTTLFTTFSNQNKWNSWYAPTTGPLVIKNLFVMPNMPNGFGGLFAQVGPGNSDNIFNLHPSDFAVTSSSYTQVLLNTYTQRNVAAENGTPYWVNRQTATIPHNFGGGWPWYNEHKVLASFYGTLNGFPDFSRDNYLDQIYNNWFLESGSSGTHQPTLTGKFGAPNLTDFKIYRYSKKPYVLKKVKHYKLKGDGVGGVKSEMYQDGIIELKYAFVQAGAYENIVTTIEPLPTAQQVEISKRYIITLVQIEEGSSSAGEMKTAANFDYKLTPPSSKSTLIQDYNTNYYSYNSNGENVVLTRITDPLGKQKFISYYELDDLETTIIPLAQNKYRYYPDPRHANNPTPIYMGPSQVFRYNRAVKDIKTEIANESVSNNQLSVNLYFYDPSSQTYTDNFKTYSEPDIPIYGNSTFPSSYKYRPHLLGKELHGFVNVKVESKSSETGQVEKTVITKHNFTHHLWGTINKVSTYSATSDLLSEDIYTFESVKAFENGLKRPGYAGFHFDYHDYWETDGLILPGMTGPIFSGYVSTYKIAANGTGTEDYRMGKLSIRATTKESKLTTPSRTERTPKVEPVLNYDIFNTSITPNLPTENEIFFESYFVKLVKKESKLYDLASVKNTTTVTEYDYFDADYKGKSTSKGFDYLYKTESSTSTPHRLWFIPSWNRYSTTVYNLETPDKKSVTENFYYYDLKNIYGCFADGFDNLPPFTNSSSNHGSNYLLSKGVMDFTSNGLAALSYSNHYGIRGILMENRVRGFKTNYPNHIHSTYYLYKTVPNSSDFNLTKSPFNFSDGVYVPPTPPTPPTPGQPYNPKPGTVINNSGNDYNPNTWGSTDPVQMGPSPDLDPTIIVINSDNSGINDWFSHPIDPEASHDLVIDVYGEANTTAGEKIHAYLTTLNGQLTGTLDEYIKTTHPQKIIGDLITSYNPNSLSHHKLGRFLLRGVHMVNDQMMIDTPPIPLGTYLDSVDVDSLNKIVYSSGYPYELEDRSDFINVDNPEDDQTDGDIYTDALRLSEVRIQIDDVVLDDFDSKNSGYNYTNLPPILQFEHLDPLTNGTQFHTFEPLFPFKTLITKKVNKLNYLGGVEEEENENGLVTKNELFEQQLIYIKDGNLTKEINLITQPLGATAKTTIGYQQGNELITTYEYYPHGLVKKINHPNGNSEEFQYDELLRPYKTIKNGKILSIHKYSSYPVYGLYTNPDILSIRSADYALTSVSFENRALANYTEAHSIIDGSGTQKGSISRSYTDPLGRNHQTSTQRVIDNVSNPKVFDTYTYHTGKTEYNSRNLPYRFYKPFEINTGTSSLGLTIQANPAPSPLFQETFYETTILARPTEAIDFGGNTTHSAKKEYEWLDKIELGTELNLTLTEKNLLMPLNATNSYIFFKSKDIDQDGKEVISYTDALGEKIATKSYSDASKTLPIITLLISNSQGKPQKVINPKKQESTYKYNILGWKYEENTPDKGTTRYIFNKSGQVTLMQDENARNGINNEVNTVPAPFYIEHKYDIFGRLTETNRINVKYSQLGITNCGGVTGICAQLSPLGHSDATTPTYSNGSEGVCYEDVFTNIKTYDWEFKTSMYVHNQCNNNSLIIADLTLVEFKDVNSTVRILKNYYNSKPDGTALPNQHSLVLSIPENTIGRLATSVAYNQTGLPIQYKYFSYNPDGKIKTEQHQFNETGIDVGATGRVTQIDYGYTYTEKLENKNVLLQDALSPAGSLSVEKQYYYEYDDFDRLKEIYFNNGTFGNGGTKIASYTYNNVFGFIEKVDYWGFNDVGCKDLAVDEITYDRTTDNRNRLTKISSKFFDWEMFYDANIPTLANTGFSNTQDLPVATTNYNGNINFTIANYKIHQTFNPPLSNPPTGNQTNLFAGITTYGYTYDGLNRLTEADATIEDHILQANNYPACLQYGDVNFTYDKIGNFTNINRYNNVNDPTTIPSPLNLNMTFNYFSNTNRLKDISNSRITNYTYDDNGNVVSDDYRHINGTKYNTNNLPYELVYDNGGGIYKDITYLYDESNFRLYKEVVNGGLTTKEYYVKDATGEIVVILDLQTPQIQQWNITDIAKAKPVQDGQDLYFYIKDHLGNTRLTYTPTICHNCSSNCNIPDYKVEHVVDYYPYGKVLREYVAISVEKFLTTGNERDVETDWDYRNARYYDADIGRFLAVDPLAHELLLWSPYVGLNDNPIYFIDPTGLFGESLYGGPGNGPGWGGFNPSSAMGSINESLRRLANDVVNAPIFEFTIGGGYRDYKINASTKYGSYRKYDEVTYGYTASYQGWTLFQNGNIDGAGKMPKIPKPDIFSYFFNNTTQVEETETQLNPNTTALYTKRKYEDGTTSRTFELNTTFSRDPIRRVSFSKSNTSYSNGNSESSSKIAFGPSFFNFYIDSKRNNNKPSVVLGARFNLQTPLPTGTTGRQYFFGVDINGGVR